MRPGVGLGLSLLLVVVWAPCARGQRRVHSPTISVALGSGLSMERWPGQSPFIERSTSFGMGAAARLAVPLAMDLNLTATAQLWRGTGPDLQAFAAGPEARLGDRHQFVLGIGPAFIRQPYQKTVTFYADGSSPDLSDSTYAFRPAIQLWTGYTWRFGRWLLGPHVSWTSSVEGVRRFHMLSAGALAGTVLQDN